MAKIPSIDYTSRDFESIFNDIKTLIPFFTQEWTNHNETDFGIVLSQLFAAVADGLHFYVDRRAAEAYITTAVSRQSVINLLKLVDFKVLAAAQASADIEFTLESTFATDLTVAAGTELQTSALTNETPIFFETALDLVIPAGQLQGTVGARHGQTVSSDLDPSDNSAFQSRVLPDTVVVDGSIRLFVDETGTEEEWFEIDSLANATQEQKVFEVRRLENDAIRISLGDNAQGKIPIGGATLRAQYIVGGGVEGNVGADRITVLTDQIVHEGNTISVSVTNPLPATGGEDEMTTEEAKVLGPRSVKTGDRGVTEEDLETLALQVPGVAKAKASVDTPAVLRIVTMFIAPAGGGQPSSTLLSDVEDALNEKKCAGTKIVADSPKYIKIDIGGQVNVLANFVQADVETAVLAAIDDLLSIDNAGTDFGEGLKIGNLYETIENTEGVDFSFLSKVAVNSLSTLDLVIWFGDGEFSEIVTSVTTVEETWTIVLLTPTTFSVTGSVSGIQSNTGTFGVEYSSDTLQVKFTITNTGTPNLAGDKATFRTSALASNAELLDNEIREKGTVDLTFVGGA